MRIQLLRNNECHSWQKFLAELREIGVEPEVILIVDDNQAVEFKFAGSPQLLIDGKDVDPMAEKITNFHVSGCRVYLWKGKVYEYPPREMIEAALASAQK